MKDLKLLVWLTQLGMSVVLPPTVLIMLAVWLRDRQGWGAWVIWIAIILGMVCAVDGLRSSLKAMEKMSEDKKKPPEGVSFNNHE